MVSRSITPAPPGKDNLPLAASAVALSNDSPQPQNGNPHVRQIRCKHCRHRYRGSMRRCPACLTLTPWRYKEVILKTVAVLLVLSALVLAGYLARRP